MPGNTTSPMLLLADPDAASLADLLPLPLEAGAGLAPPPRPEGPRYLYSNVAALNDLPQQRWGVIYPEGEAWRVDAVRDLIEARAEDQGIEPAAVKRFAVPGDMDAERSTAWIKDILVPSASASELPRYLLLLGDLDEVSLELQQALAVKYLPGRLAFSMPEPYEAYAQKVCGWRKRPSSVQARVVSATARSGRATNAPDAGYRDLMAPAVKLALAAKGTRLEEAPLSIPARRDELLSLTRAADLPTVLWTMSHGIGHAADYEMKRRQQGALLWGTDCSRAEHLISADDVASGPFLPGGFWFIFACFGAGTPKKSVYWHWLEHLKQKGDENLARYDLSRALQYLPSPEQAPFVAALPSAALANPDGPLAVLGHVDLAWAHSFRTPPGTGVDPVRLFLEAPSLLADRRSPSRAGAATWAFQSQLAQVDSSLVNLFDAAERLARKADTQPANPVDPIDLGRLFMLRQDLRAYMLLGDPAVQLNIGPPQVRAESTADGAAWPTPERMVGAVIEVLGGKRASYVAGQVGVAEQDLAAWVQTFREAGAAALDELKSNRRGRA